ncbi:MAG: hypothetical protein JSU01_11030 [Bacteroidetes bacterium]|nr:hypothetical protein [Bacteroidota bacterium]
MKKVFMSAVALVAFSLSIVLFQLSCKKQAVAQPVPPTIQGLWIGTYTVAGQPELGQQYFSLIIKPDGTMIADTKGQNTQHLAPGNWSLAGNQLSCTYKCVYGLPANVGITEIAIATWDKTGKLTGTWKDDPDTQGNGEITLTKVN